MSAYGQFCPVAKGHGGPRRAVDAGAWPQTRTVVAFRFTDIAASVGRWWLVGTAGEVDVCDYDPGFEVTVRITSTLRTATEIWRGDRTWAAAVRAGEVAVEGPTTVRRALPRWLGQSQLAAVPRPA